VLQTGSGLTVMAMAGQLSIPPGAATLRAKDGTNFRWCPTAPLHRPDLGPSSELVNPPQPIWCAATTACLPEDGSSAEAEPNVTLISGALESSNVQRRRRNGQHDFAGAPVRHADETACSTPRTTTVRQRSC